MGQRIKDADGAITQRQAKLQEKRLISRSAIHKSEETTMEEPTITITVKGKDMVRKVPKKQGGTGFIYVPKAWLGKEVVAILVE